MGTWERIWHETSSTVPFKSMACPRDITSHWINYGRRPSLYHSPSFRRLTNHLFPPDLSVLVRYYARATVACTGLKCFSNSPTCSDLHARRANHHHQTTLASAQPEREAPVFSLLGAQSTFARKDQLTFEFQHRATSTSSIQQSDTKSHLAGV